MVISPRFRLLRISGGHLPLLTPPLGGASQMILSELIACTYAISLAPGCFGVCSLLIDLDYESSSNGKCYSIIRSLTTVYEMALRHCKYFIKTS